MSTWQPKPPLLPLRKPPGYRDPCSTPTPRPRPPPKPVTLPPSFRRDQRRCCCCRAFCCTLLIATVILALILSAACAIFYLWFQPRLPEIRVKSIDYTVSSPRGLTPEYSRITTRLEIQNPNRNLKMVYGKSRVLLRGVYKDWGAVLGDGTVSGFTQETKNVTALEIRTKVGRDEVLNSYKGGEEVEKGIKSKKNLLVNVEIRSGVGIKGNDGWSTGIVKVKLVCEGMRLSRGKLNGGKESKCRIMILDW